MAIRKTLAQRLYNIARINGDALFSRRVSSPVRSRLEEHPGQGGFHNDPGDKGLSTRFIHKRAAFCPETYPQFMSVSARGKLSEKLREISVSKDRIRLDQMIPPVKGETGGTLETAKVTVDDARKLLRVAQMERVKSRLRDTEKSWISYQEFLRMCSEICLDKEEGIRVAKILDQSGNVIVLGNSVCLKPEQVTEAIANQIPLHGLTTNPNHPRMEEFKKLDAAKAEIDEEADAAVRRELWAGLGYLIIQTVGFMRLTFWELSWDVMEPICFYVTSTYFMAGYAFFLRTSKEPSFEGFYQSRFESKQRKLMTSQGFDLNRYEELQKMLGLKGTYPFLNTGSGFGLLPHRR